MKKATKTGPVDPARAAENLRASLDAKGQLIDANSDRRRLVRRAARLNEAKRALKRGDGR